MNLRQLYTRHLIPAAQLLMVMSATYRGITNTGARQMHFPLNGKNRSSLEILEQFLHDAYDALNIANCEAQSWPADLPDRDARAYAISEAVDLLKARWRAELERWTSLSGFNLQTMATNSVLGTWTGAHRALNGNVVRSLASFTMAQASALNVLFDAIGYAHKTRSTWLAKRASVNTVLMPLGRISAWRTLARNASWNGTLDYLGMAVDTCSVRRFGSTVGRARLESLMTEAFHDEVLEVGVQLTPAPTTAIEAPVSLNETVSDQVEEPAVVQAPTPSEDVLPQGIRVESTVEGLLRVTATRNPAQGLTASDIALFTEFSALGEQAHRPSPLVELSSVTTCGPTGFATAVGEAAQWLDTQEDLQAEAVREFSSFKMRRTTLAKLHQAFSGDELEFLREHFAAQAA